MADIEKEREVEKLLRRAEQAFSTGLGDLRRLDMVLEEIQSQVARNETPRVSIGSLPAGSMVELKLGGYAAGLIVSFLLHCRKRMAAQHESVISTLITELKDNFGY